MSQLIDEERLKEILQQGSQYLEWTRDVVGRGLVVPLPWDDAGEFQVDEDVQSLGMKWCVENAEMLQTTGEGDLEKLGERMEHGIDALCEDDSSDSDRFYESLFLLISTQDGLVSWLCENIEHEDISPSYPNGSGEPVYFNAEKKKAVEQAFMDYSLFREVDDDEIQSIWNRYWQHRHRIMHGHPDAEFNKELAIASLFYLGAISMCVLWKYDDVSV